MDQLAGVGIDDASICCFNRSITDADGAETEDVVTMKSAVEQASVQFEQNWSQSGAELIIRSFAIK